jgi:hypothetical protein
VLELRRGVALMLDDVVDDGESTGSRGRSGGGRSRGIALWRTPAIDRAIGVVCSLIEEGKMLRRIREMRRAWCEEIRHGSSPFIG